MTTTEHHLGLFTDTENRGPSCHTFKGGRFYVLNPRAEDVDLEDIGEALSKQCRFNGHTLGHYSVAQHSVLVSEVLGENGWGYHLQMLALLHDAAEAYMGDVTRPVKAILDDVAPGVLQDIDARIEAAILERFHLSQDLMDSFQVIIKWADNVVLATEKRDVLHPIRPGVGTVDDLPEPMWRPIHMEPPAVAAENFWDRFYTLWGRLGRTEEDLEQ